jgi:hypothetical protein
MSCGCGGVEVYCEAMLCCAGQLSDETIAGSAKRRLAQEDWLSDETTAWSAALAVYM